jgi:DNA-binding NarL/FixJ family response regulator
MNRAMTIAVTASRAVVASRPEHVEALTSSVLASGVVACASACSGFELMRCLKRSIPDVLLLDTDLDDRHGGFDVLDGRAPTNVPTVLVADDVDAETLALARQTGAAGFLAWPCSQSQVDATLCLALGSARSDPTSADQQLLRALGALRSIARALEQVRHLVPAAEPEPRLRPLPGLSELSAREWEVLMGLLDHKRVPALARALHISPHTVRNHLKSIFTKLGVHSQAELLDKVVDRSA